MVEDNLEDEQFLSEAILEIEETHQWCNWHGASVVHVGELGDALDCLRAESYVAILLNLSLPDSPMLLETFQQVIAAAGGTPTDLASLTVYVVDLADYRAHGREIGAVWRRLAGRIYPAMAAIGVSRLWDEAAMVEIQGFAVIG